MTANLNALQAGYDVGDALNDPDEERDAMNERDTATYRTFLRSARNFEEFASAEKIEVHTDLTIVEARDACEVFNWSRTPEQIEMGTKLEFEEE